MKLKRKSGSFLVVDVETQSFAVKPIAHGRYSLDDIVEDPQTNPPLPEPENGEMITKYLEGKEDAQQSSSPDQTNLEDLPDLDSVLELTVVPDSHLHFNEDVQDFGNSNEIPGTEIEQENVSVRAPPPEETSHQNEESSQNVSETSTGTFQSQLENAHVAEGPKFSITGYGISFKDTDMSTGSWGNKDLYISERPRWRSWLTFQLCSMGVLFSLGTTWRFPSLAYENFGGTFVFAYLITWLIIGLPVLVLEQLVGQFAHKGPWKIWACVPLFRGIALTQCIISTYLLAMFNILLAWFGVYFSSSFSKPLSWSSSLVINGSGSRNVSSAEHYFQNNILKFTDLESISSIDYRMIIAILIAAVLVAAICIFQLRIFEIVIPILATLVLALFIALLCYACLQHGVKDGIAYFFTPQWHHLWNSKVWYSALTQVIYSHNIGLGVHTTLSSLNRFEWPVTRYAIITSIASMLFTILASMTVFILLSNMAFRINMPIENAVDLGYGLIFIVVADAVSTMALSPQAFSAVIFAVLFICGMVSPAVCIINIITVVQSRFKWILKRDWMAVLPLVLLGFLISLVFATQGGIYFLKIFDAYGVSVPALVCLGLEAIGFLWIYGIKLIQRDFNMITASYAKWLAAVGYITPVLILVGRIKLLKISYM